MIAKDMVIVGGQTPSGTVRVSGAKNAATRLMAAALLTEEPVVLSNFPIASGDAEVKARFMQRIGATVETNRAEHQLRIEAHALTLDQLDNYDYPIRTTYLLAAGQLLRFGQARIPYPGGCRIGNRGYDLHVMVWERLGCTVREHTDHIEIICPRRLEGNRISFPISTVGGTENALLCAAVAHGTTHIENAYITPEIDNLIDMLRRMGARIEISGNSFIRVEGVDRLAGTSIAIIPDRIEALTWIVYALMARGPILIKNVPFATMEVPLIHIGKAGVDLFRNSTDAFVNEDCLQERDLQPFEVACGTYPGVISDMQPLFVLLGLIARGRSRIFDYRYPERTAYAEQLAKLCPGALQWQSGSITTKGVVRFTGADVYSTDLRGSITLILAGLCAAGTTRVYKATMAMRGYDDLVAKLEGLGLEVGLENSC